MRQPGLAAGVRDVGSPRHDEEEVLLDAAAEHGPGVVHPGEVVRAVARELQSAPLGNVADAARDVTRPTEFEVRLHTRREELLRRGRLLRDGVAASPHAMPAIANVRTSMRAHVIRVSWIKNEDLIDCLKSAGVMLSADKAAKALTSFKRLESYMEKRFALFARFITFGLAVVVALLFQVSTPDLLRRLWSDAELRSRYVAMGKQLEGENAPAALRVSSGTLDLQTLNLEALGDIAPSYPNEAAAFEEFSGKADDPTDGREELAAALEDSPQKDKILAEFEQALDRRLTDAQQRGTLMSNEATARLATLDITPWKHGWKFYRGTGAQGLAWDRLAGVLLTALLLTFGAPFWYARLKDVARLRDVVSGKVQETATQTIAETQTNQTRAGGTQTAVTRTAETKIAETKTADTGTAEPPSGERNSS